MGLVLTLGNGEAFYVDDQRFAVIEIVSDALCRLQTDHGKKFDIANTNRTEILPSVSIRIAFKSNSQHIRLDIEAPKSVILATETNYLDKKKEDARTKGANCVPQILKAQPIRRVLRTDSNDLAILAPVPHMHIESGIVVAEKEGFVAFGSNKWELFRKVDELRGKRRIPMLIYPSHEESVAKVSFRICWFGWYVGHVQSRGGAHPRGMKHRPPSTAGHASDNRGHWAIFWHVEELQPLPEELHLQISEIETVRGGWRKNAPPRGPELVAVPPSLGQYLST